MGNELLFKLKNKLKLNLKGKNINNFIKRLNDNGINLYYINVISNNEANIIILESDYEKLLKIKSIYEVNNIDIYGIIRVRKILKKYKYIIMFFVLGVIFIWLLSNIIFSVNIVSDNKELKNILLNELTDNGIKKYSIRKNYNDIQSIKENILNKYKDKIEWLEIENIGTNYTVKFQERIIKKNEEEYVIKNIVASKSAIIKSIVVEKGFILKEINEYVRKGDIIVSSSILSGQSTPVKGNVYGEVWYTVRVEYPYIYEEVKETGNIKNSYVLSIFNKNFELSFNKYKNKITEDKVLLKSLILPIKLLKQRQIETINTSLILTKEEAIKSAYNEAINKIKLNLNDKEKIITSSILKTNELNDKVIIDVFFSVLEDITEYKEIGDEGVS